MQTGWRVVRAAATLIAVLALTACSLHMPTDPYGSLEHARGGTLRVGVSPNGDLAVVEENHVSGSEAELVKGYAKSIDAKIEWTVGSEEALVRGLETQQLDIVIAGITDTTPWAERAGMTRPYRSITADDGSTLNLVMLVPMGENALLSSLETYLDSQREKK
ncbi:transporter substrate-binding domain-containing protein [Paramicrobacterium sp. CJ85]|uniref:transporter substrate-binding domain-containing protein n=1 Tax=Paramicrobacterium sp. CJ85 TaxID=3445355 RepID=UPI003F60ECBC